MKNACLKHTNKNKTSTLITSLFCAFVLLSLSACGQRGALFIPNTPEAAQRSTIGDVLTKPANPAQASTLAPSSPPTTQTPLAPAK